MSGPGLISTYITSYQSPDVMWPDRQCDPPMISAPPLSPGLYLFEDLLMTMMRWCTLHYIFLYIRSHACLSCYVRCLSRLYLNICYEFNQEINLLCWEKVSIALIKPVVPYSTVCNPDLRGAEEMPEEILPSVQHHELL